MITLGINAAFHDCSAALIDDGEIVAAAEEERFTHVKHGKRPLPFSTWQLPYHAIDFCLAQAGLQLHEVDRYAYAFDPQLLQESTPAGSRLANRRSLPASIKLPLQPSLHAQNGSAWDPLFLAYVVNAPRQLVDGAPHALHARFAGASHTQVQERWRFVEHHLAHEASAFLCSPFEHCAVLTLDGRGERVSSSAGVYENGRYRRLRQVPLPDSIGLLYEEFTRWLGFLHSADEYKVMALASFGSPRYAELFDSILRYDGDGGYQVMMPNLQERFGAARTPGSPLQPRHYDLACSLQRAVEDTVLEMARWLQRESGTRHLAMAGGVALNCVLNSRLRDDGPFDSVWVQPAAGDAGTALGAALWIDHRERPAASTSRRKPMTHAYLGPAYDDEEIESLLQWAKLPYRRLRNIAADTATLLAQDRVIGWFQSRMEFGPRALGARSILASPCSPGMQQRLNEIKDREDFRPVAPVVIEECAQQWFLPRPLREALQLPSRINAAAPLPAAGAAGPSPFMLFVFDVAPEHAARIPAVRHVDGTARIQTINREQHPLYYQLLLEFEKLSGVPVLVNTSFNTRGRPMVCTPRDALETFWTSPLDALVMGSFLIEKAPWASPLPDPA